MEHRLGRRIAVQLAVTISGKQSGILHGEIQDLSVEGAFIRLHKDMPSLRNVVRLSFAPPTTDPELCDCRALIVRKENDGIGVMFRRRQHWVFSELANMPENTRSTVQKAFPLATSLPAISARPAAGISSEAP